MSITEAMILSEDYPPPPERQQYTMNEFIEYMSSNLLVLSSFPSNFSVFCSRECNRDLPPSAAALPPQTNEPSTSAYGLMKLVPAAQEAMSHDQAEIQERIKRWLLSLTWYFWESLLIQFWEPTIIKGQRFLTTSRKPFALKTLYKGPCWYRKHCMIQNIFVDEGAEKEGLGPLGRVFLSGQPESSPDLRFYSIKEYPLRDLAMRCGLRRYMALPVFELQSNCCVGVLELVSFNSEQPLVCFELSQKAFEESNLTILHMGGQSNTQIEGRTLALNEIREMFAVVNETPNIALALAWIPCQGCSGNCSSMELAVWAYDPEWNKGGGLINNDFLQASWFHKLEPGKGVAGKAILSDHKLCFCRSIYGFGISEYPLAHYARKSMLTISFAICLQSAHTGSDQYVLEFFMRPGDQDEGDPRSLIHSLLVRMTRQLLSFKVASGQDLREELHMLIDPTEEFGGGEVDSNTQAGNTTAAAAAVTSTLQSGAEEATASFAKQRKDTNSNFHISYEQLEHLFGTRQKEAAGLLGVSLSTFKRACKSHKISRWRSHVRNKANHSPFEVKLTDTPDQDAGFSRASINPSTCAITVQDPKLVTVKANYQSKTVKFQLCTSSGFAELEKQVAKRLKLKTGDFETSYEDEDGHSILLTCDEDLWLCNNTLTSMCSTTIQLFVNSS